MSDRKPINSKSRKFQKKKALIKIDSFNQFPCPICGQSCYYITYLHLERDHQMTPEEFIKAYPNHKFVTTKYVRWTGNYSKKESKIL